MKSLLGTMFILMGMMISCQPVEKTARDSAAALGGAVTAAQTQYHDTCVSNPSQGTCQAINKGVNAENALITAIETYCGWSTSAPPQDMNAPCVPVKTAQTALNAAISNANTLTVEITAIIKGGK